MYTNKGLVKHAEKALALKTKYMWGGILRPITADYVNMLSSLYGASQYSASRISELKKLANRGYFGVDCVGLIKSYYWSGKPNGGTGSPKYGKPGFPDVNVGAMFAAAKVKGVIGTMPETPGIILYSKTHPHVGVYIGNGETIESTLGSRGDGVVKRKLDGLWEYWFECPYITYEKAAESAETSLKVGDKVKVKPGAPVYGTTQKFRDWVYNSVLYVREFNGDRIIISTLKTGDITGAIDRKYLTKI